MGYSGFYDDESWVRLTPENVKEIHTQGGTVLGTSRGGSMEIRYRMR